MKFLSTLLIFALTALAVRADLTPTNAVKGSALPSATTPLGGSESVFLIQSGATKIVTVNQLIASATAQANAITNSLQTQITANAATAAANTATASNFLYKVAGTNTTLIAAVSNYFATVTAGNATATATASNLLWLTIGTNTTAIAAINAAGYQTAGQVSTAINSAIAAAIGGVTNSGALNGTNILTPQGKNFISTWPILLDLAAGNYQTVTASNVASLSFTVTNAADGQNVSLLILKAGSKSQWATMSATVPNGFRLISTTFNTISQTANAAAQCQVFGTNIVLTAGQL